MCNMLQKIDKQNTIPKSLHISYIEVSPTQGVGGALHETGHTHKIMRGNHVDSSFRHLDSPADSVKDRLTINKAVLIPGKAPVRYLMKKLHEKQEIIPSIEPPFCGRQLLKFLSVRVRIREVTLYCYSYTWDLQNCPLYGIEGFRYSGVPLFRGSFYTLLYGLLAGTAANVRYREVSAIQGSVIEGFQCMALESYIKRQLLAF